ncbi:unnamed protein product [Vitrella brassicaformis CCMP3155]|uniref:Uncharacterized protein n=1 Tax=Vitrella brassicaformis (strain CCMP3155) TaxID=1169540 RepID=A0A0G4E9L5_VITBC|nr:unnamed protein product [Vitrella brassicaformis CCMP3155]|eukprot:CEL92589.1 unnamed protein product [Vitrella brassicaformis CCMP3155]
MGVPQPHAADVPQQIRACIEACGRVNQSLGRRWEGRARGERESGGTFNTARETLTQATMLPTVFEEPAAAAAAGGATGWLHVDEAVFDTDMVTTKVGGPVAAAAAAAAASSAVVFRRPSAGARRRMPTPVGSGRRMSMAGGLKEVTTRIDGIHKKLEQHLANKKKQADTKEKNDKATQAEKEPQRPTLNKAAQTNTPSSIVVYILYLSDLFALLTCCLVLVCHRYGRCILFGEWHIPCQLSCHHHPVRNAVNCYASVTTPLPRLQREHLHNMFSDQRLDPKDGSYAQDCGIHACNMALQYPALPQEKAHFKRTTSDAFTAAGVLREEDWHRLCLGDVGRFTSNKQRDNKEPGVREGERRAKGSRPTISLAGVKGDDNALDSKIGLLTDMNEERAGAVMGIMLREDVAVAPFQETILHLLTFKPLRDGYWADGDSIMANNRNHRVMTVRDTAERVNKDSIVVFGDEEAYNAAKKQQQDNRDVPIALDDDDELQPPAPAAAAMPGSRAAGRAGISVAMRVVPETPEPVYRALEETIADLKATIA